MASVTWLGAVYENEGVAHPVYSWDLTGNWSTGILPGLSDDVTIVAGTPGEPVLQDSRSINSLTMNAGSSLTIGSFNSLGGQTYLAGTLAVAGNVADDGGIGLDNASENTGGSSLTVGGVLDVGSGGTLAVGNDLQAAATAATAGSVANLGSIAIAGYAGSSGSPVKPPVLAELIVNSAAGFGGQTGVLTGTVQLGVGPGGGGGSGDALLDFAGGGLISTIEGSVALTGPLAYVASGSATTSNSALTGPLTIASGGSLALQDAAPISLPSLTDAGSFAVDGGFLSIAATSVTISGQLNVSAGKLSIGRSAFAAGSSSPTVTVGSILTNTSSNITIDGDAGQSVSGVLDVGSAAGFDGAGVLAGYVSLADASLIDFTGGGSITSIAANSNLVISGPEAFLASGTSTTSNSALTGLATVAGALTLSAGVTVTTATLVDSGTISVDTNFLGAAGTHLNVTNGLTVSGDLTIGRSAFATGTTSPVVSVGSLTYSSTGSISLDGDANQDIAGILDVGSAPAGGALTGNVSLSDDSLLDYTSGGSVTSISYGGHLVISGTKAFLASGAATSSNSALANLATVDGVFTLIDGASLTINNGVSVGNGTNYAYVNLDNSDGGGGALTIQGAMTFNGGELTVGNGSITSASTATVNALDFTGATLGEINVEGASAVQATLDVGSSAGFGQAGALSGGQVNLQGDALLDFTGGGYITSTAFGANLTINGTNAYLASGSNTTGNSALGQLATLGGDLTLLNSAAVTTSAALTVGDGTHGADAQVSNGASLTTQLALTLAGSPDVLSVGGGSDSLNSLATAASLSNLGGEINIYSDSGAGVKGTLDVLGGAVNNGAINVTGGLLEVGGALSGSGTVTLSKGGTVTLAGGYSNAIAFQGAGTLALAQSGSGVISGFGVGDAIDMTSIAYSATDYVTEAANGGGETVLIDNASGTTIASFNVGSTYAPSQFAIENDGSNHLEIGFAQVASDFTGNGTSDILLAACRT